MQKVITIYNKIVAGRASYEIHENEDVEKYLGQGYKIILMSNSVFDNNGTGINVITLVLQK